MKNARSFILLTILLSFFGLANAQVTSSSPCTNPPGDPSVFGNGFWNVYCYNGNMVSNPTKTYYVGMYTENNLSFDTRSRYPYSNIATDVPSKANTLSGYAYSGCNPMETIHTIIYKRIGFPCGIYQIDVPVLDDIGYLSIDGIVVWNYSSCCVAHTNIWTGFLTNTSKIEFKLINGASGSAVALKFKALTPVANIATNTLCNQFTASWSAIPQTIFYSLDLATDVAFTNIVPGYSNLNVGNTTSFNVNGLSSGATYYYRIKANTSCGGSANSNSIKVDLSVTPSGSTTWLGKKSNDWFDAVNWCGGVPSATVDAYIPTGTAFMPQISSATASVDNIQIDANASLTNNKTLSVYGDWYNNGNYISNTGTVEMRAAYSSINGTGNNNFHSLAAKTPSYYWWYGNTKGSIQLNSSISVNGNLTLTNGIIYTSASRTLTINEGGSISIGNENSYIDGPVNYVVAKTGNTEMTLPLGDDGDWRPAVVTLDHSDNSPVVYTAELNKASAQALGYTLPTTITAVSAVHYWQIDRQNVSNLNNAHIKLYYGVNDQVNDYKNLVVANASAVQWKNIGGQATSDTTGTITSGTFTSFGKFALGNMESGDNALPVSFLGFKAYKEGSTVQLEWSTAFEKNNDFFTVEKSTDGSTFNAIGTIKGAGNSNIAISYKTADEKLTSGVSYYRIRQTDFDKKITFSMIVCVTYTPSAGLTVCPNPSNSGSTMMVSLPESSKEALIVVRDIQGQEYYSKVILSTEDHQLIAITTQPDLAPGMYIVVASSDNNIYSQKIIVK